MRKYVSRWRCYTHPLRESIGMNMCGNDLYLHCELGHCQSDVPTCPLGKGPGAFLVNQTNTGDYFAFLAIDITNAGTQPVIIRFLRLNKEGVVKGEETNYTLLKSGEKRLFLPFKQSYEEDDSIQVFAACAPSQPFTQVGNTLLFTKYLSFYVTVPDIGCPPYVSQCPGVTSVQLGQLSVLVTYDSQQNSFIARSPPFRVDNGGPIDSSFSKYTFTDSSHPNPTPVSNLLQPPNNYCELNDVLGTTSNIQYWLSELQIAYNRTDSSFTINF